MRKSWPGGLAFIASLLLVHPAPAQEKGSDKDKKADVAEDINKPRADARKITFTTSEATWASLDVSPDGRTIVFDLLGDIYALPIAGGAATRLTSGPAYD